MSNGCRLTNSFLKRNSNCEVIRKIKRLLNTDICVPLRFPVQVQSTGSWGIRCPIMLDLKPKVKIWTWKPSLRFYKFEPHLQLCSYLVSTGEISFDKFINLWMFSGLCNTELHDFSKPLYSYASFASSIQPFLSQRWDNYYYILISLL